MGNRKTKRRGNGRRWLLRTLLASAVAGLGLIAIIWAAIHLTKPSSAERKEIAPGVYYEVVKIEGPGAQGVAMVAEIHWDTPGIEVAIRPFDRRAIERNHHYILTIPDWVIARERDLVLFINGTRYTPADPHRNLPGMTVGTVETVMVDGELSHLHENSYLLWWNEEGRATFETTKPPSETAREHGVTGISVQGISVQDGRSRHSALRDPDGDPMRPRSFIGIDPERRILWLITYENATSRFMAEFAAEQGVVVGGMLDSGNAATMLIGRGAEGVLPFTGLRAPRPLANYITIRRTENQE